MLSGARAKPTASLTPRFLFGEFLHELSSVVAPRDPVHWGQVTPSFAHRALDCIPLCPSRRCGELHLRNLTRTCPRNPAWAGPVRQRQGRAAPAAGCFQRLQFLSRVLSHPPKASGSEALLLWFDESGFQRCAPRGLNRSGHGVSQELTAWPQARESRISGSEVPTGDTR